jgi:ankyrin repeat protein
MNTVNDDDLFAAIKRNDIARASSLISCGAVNVNGKLLPLIEAAALGRVEIMTMLLDAGVEIDAVDNYDRTACHAAIFSNHFDVLKLLVERGANLGVGGESLLVSAAQQGGEEGNQMLILLIDGGAPLDDLPRDDVMNLVQSVAVFQRLSARFANLTALRDLFGHTLCYYVARNVVNVEDLCFFVDLLGKDEFAHVNYNGETPLHWAALNVDKSALRVLVELGVEIDRQESVGWTALHKVAGRWSHDGSYAELLLALGADVRLVTIQGDTAAHIASTLDNFDALCACLAAGNDLDEHDNDGHTARRTVVERGFHLPTAAEIDGSRARIAKTRLDLVRGRALEICVGLQPLSLDALQLCEIMAYSFEALGSLIAFHQWWAIATKVKHFLRQKYA